MSGNTIAAYGLGCLFPENLANNTAAISKAGWTALMMGLVHVSSDGDLSYNSAKDDPLCTGGSYVGPGDLTRELKALMSYSPTSLQTLYMTIGGGQPNTDFTNIHAIYEAAGKTFSGTNLEKNFQALKLEVGTDLITAIDMDVEDKYEQPSFQAFCEMILGMGWKISFCPSFSEYAFWGETWAALLKNYTDPVVRINLQCYAGADPTTWETQLKKWVPKANYDGFIVAGAIANTPQDVQNAIAAVAKEPSVGGGFIWHLGAVFDQQDEYVAAIEKGLSSS